MLILGIVLLAGLAKGELPHRTCSYDTDGFLECDRASIEIPNTFDLNLVPPDLSRLWLNCPRSHRHIYCNVLRRSSRVPQGLPYRASLSSVSLYGFRNDDGSQLSVGGLLRNNNHITYLYVCYSKIHYVDRDFLTGFHSLTTLHLSDNDIADINIDAFEGLIFPPHDSVLRDLDLSENRLQQLDWNVFLPVANSLVELNLSLQQPKLRTLHHSGPDFQLMLTALHMDYNGLQSIPFKVLDSLTPIQIDSSTESQAFHFRENAFCLSSGRNGCACCEVAGFMRWMKAFTNASLHYNDVRPEIRFSCGSRSTEYTNNEEGLARADALIRRCSPSHAQTASPRQAALSEITNSSKATFIIQNNTNELQPACSEPKIVEIICNASHLTLSDSDLLQAEGTTIIFSSDGTFVCSRKLYELHMMAMELFDIAATNVAERQFETVDITCYNGRVEINSLDPERSRAKRLIFRTDLNVGCYSKFTRFLEYVDGNMVENSRLENISADPGFSLDDWLHTQRECERISALTANCTDGVFSFSWVNISTTSASGIAIRSDETFECRQKLVSIHDHVLSQKATTVQRPTLPVHDAVVAVCRKGRVLVSEGSPRRSTKAMLELYYYVTTKLCQDAFRKCLDFLLTLA